MSKTTFKVGDRVRVKDVPDAMVTNSSKGKTGTVTKYERGRSYPIIVKFDDPDERDENYEPHQLEPLVKDWDNLEVGDHLLGVDGNGLKEVLGVAGKVYFLSEVDRLTTLDAGWTVEEMKERGFTIKQAKTTEPVELSIADLEKRLDLAPGSLRVKKD